MGSRKQLFLLLIAIAVLFGVVGFVLGGRLKSPEDARAEVAAPEPSLIGALVETATLSNDVVLRGDAEFEGAVDLELDSSLGGGDARVVTGRVPDVDSEVNEGDVIIEVAGRPVFVLQGALPAFREFRPGIEGDDVLQLEEALARLGYFDAEPDRLFGSSTEDAIAALYEAEGYEAPAATDTQESTLDSARDAVELSREQLANATDTLSDLRSPLSEVDRINRSEAREGRLEAIDKSLEALEDARDARDEAQASVPSVGLSAAIEQLTLAESTGDEAAIRSANQALQSAQDADRRSLEVADEGVEAAEEAVAEAREALADYDRLTAAQDADAADTSRAEDAVTDAEEALAEREADLAELEDEIGVRFPAAEIVFLPELPRTVTSVDVERGDFVNGAVMRISGTEIKITTGVSEANRPLLETGQRVVIDSAQLDIEVEGEITFLSDRKGTNGIADTRYYMVVEPRGEYEVSDLVGINFRLQIPLEKTEGEVLAVPLAALSQGADGSSRVEVILDDDRTEVVAVEPGLLDKNRSLVEITPIGGSVVEGDFVVIGVDVPQVVEADESDVGDDGGDDEADGE